MTVKEISTLTIDLRIDYLEPAETNLTAKAAASRDGINIIVVDGTIFDSGESHVASGRAVFKTRSGEETPWTKEAGQE